MASLPQATTRVSEIATAAVGGTDLIALLGPVPTNADATPRLFGSASAIYAQHGYSELLEYAALHTAETKKPMLVIGIPIETPGAITREVKTGNTGNSVSTLAAGGDGVLCEHDGVIMVIEGGTVGASQIILGLSLDGGRTTKRVRLGTATSYTIPYVGVAVSFTTSTLVTGDTIHTWHGSGPRGDAAGWILAFAALAAQARQFRSVLLFGDLQHDTEATAFLSLLNAYETSYDRFVFGRASVRDRLDAFTQAGPELVSASHVMATAVLSFDADNGDSLTRATGSWYVDGFADGDVLTISGTQDNDGVTTTPVRVVSDTVIGLTPIGGRPVVDEMSVSGVTVTGEPSLTFAEGEAGDTITRSAGSWIAEGFEVNDVVTITGTTTNDGPFTVTAVGTFALSFADGVLTAELIGATGVTMTAPDRVVTAGQSKAAWMATITAEFSTIDTAPRISLGAGRGRVFSPFTGWSFRWSPSWAASLREYQHDLHIAPWRKADGNTGFDLYDAEGTLAEWDDRVDGAAASAARFTSFRTWSNGPGGAYLAQSLTRAVDASLLVQTHNVAVVNLAQGTCQAATEDAIGKSLTLNDDGTATTESLKEIESSVNSALSLALLTNTKNEGARASSAQWDAATDDVLNVPEATLTGVLTLNLNGTIHSVNTTVRVRSGGQ